MGIVCPVSQFVTYALRPQLHYHYSHLERNKTGQRALEYGIVRIIMENIEPSLVTDITQHRRIRQNNMLPHNQDIRLFPFCPLDHLQLYSHPQLDPI